MSSNKPHSVQEATRSVRRTISGTFDELLSYVGKTLQLREDLESRARWGKSVDALPAYRRWLARLIDRALKAETMLLLTARVQPELQRELRGAATQAERRTPRYVHAVANYWVEDLAEGCCTAFALDASSVATLTQVSNDRKGQSAWFRVFSVKWWIGVVVAGLTLFATIMPKEAFEGLNGSAHTYAHVRGVLAGVSLLLLTIWLGRL